MLTKNCLLSLLFIFACSMTCSFAFGHPKAPRASFFSPQISPDGTQYLWESLERGGSLWLSNSSGEKLQYLTVGHSPNWIDDQTIKFVRSKDDGHKILERHLYRYSLDGNVAVFLNEGENPDYKPTVMEEPDVLFSDRPLSGEVVVLDPGHGKSSGVLSPFTEVFEDRYALLTANIVKDYLQRMGASTPMTRVDNSVCPSLSSRVNFSNSKGASSFCSIHYNGAANSAAHGLEVFHRSYNSGSKRQARLLHDRMEAATGLYSRGVKGDKEWLGFYLGVLSYRHKTDNRCLTEGAFLTNESNALTVDTPKYRKAVAWAIYAGLCDTLEVDALDPISDEVEPFSDDFASALSPSWFGAKAETVQEDTPSGDGRALAVYGKEHGFSALRRGGALWSNYRFSARCRASSAELGQYGLIARASASAEDGLYGYILLVDEVKATATIYASLGSSNELLSLGRKSLSSLQGGQWRELSLSCRDSYVRASIDGEEIVGTPSIAAPSAAIMLSKKLARGGLGFYLSKTDSAKLFVDDCNLEALNGPLGD